MLKMKVELETKFDVGDVVLIARSDNLVFRVSVIGIDVFGEAERFAVFYRGRIWRRYPNGRISDYPTPEITLREHDLGEVVPEPQSSVPTPTRTV
jgi:hypothetical protein